MKRILILLSMLVFSTAVFAGSKKVTVHYEFKFDYKKVVAGVVCVTAIDGREEGDGDIIDQLIWIAPKDYPRVKDLKAEGFTPELRNTEKCEAYPSANNQTPTVIVYTYSYVSNSDVRKAMSKAGVEYVERELLYVKENSSREQLIAAKQRALEAAKLDARK